MNKTNKKVILQDVRASYVYLDKPNKNGKFSMQLLIDKKSPNYKRAMVCQQEALEEAFGADAWKKKGKYKLALRDGDADLENGGEARDGEEYHNVIFCNANNSRKPGVVNRNNEPADEDDMEKYAYSGAYFHASISFYSFAGEDGSKPGIAVSLNNVMLRKAGPRLDGSTSAKSEFEEFAEEGDDDDSEDEDF